MSNLGYQNKMVDRLNVSVWNLKYFDSDYFFWVLFIIVIAKDKAFAALESVQQLQQTQV